LGRWPLGAILHSSNEPGELSQWLCHDDSTINIVVVIIIIIMIDCPLTSVISDDGLEPSSSLSALAVDDSSELS